MRVLVCGGRRYGLRPGEREGLWQVLDTLHPHMSELMSGGSPGADTLAWDWARRHNVHCERYFADWQTHGRASGPIRNRRMLDHGKPTLVLACTGGSGTADMMQRAIAAGVEVRQVAAATA